MHLIYTQVRFLKPMSDHVLTALNALQTSHCQRGQVLAPQQPTQGPGQPGQLNYLPAGTNHPALPSVAEGPMFPWALVT